MWTGASPHTVIVADVNNDGRLDVETANYAASTATVLLGNGDGDRTFSAKTDFSVTGAGPYGLDVLDMNRDGAPDGVTANYTVDTASVLDGSGDGTFSARADFATGAWPVLGRSG